MVLDSCCPTDPVTTILPLSILLASLLGSLHCTAMCGGLVLASTRSTLDVALYHIGRLFSYSTLGYFSGTIGQTILHFSWAPIIIGVGFIVFGVASLFQRVEFSFPFAPVLLKKLLASKQSLPQKAFAFLVGLGSIFLPCGWLYTFVIAVSQTHNPLYSAGLMILFWMGTLPALTIAPMLLKKVINRYSRGLSAVIYIGIGLLTLL